jgi:hypothetical protein
MHEQFKDTIYLLHYFYISVQFRSVLGICSLVMLFALLLLFLLFSFLVSPEP